MIRVILLRDSWETVIMYEKKYQFLLDLFPEICKNMIEQSACK